MLVFSHWFNIGNWMSEPGQSGGQNHKFTDGCTVRNNNLGGKWIKSQCPSMCNGHPSILFILLHDQFCWLLPI